MQQSIYLFTTVIKVNDRGKNKFKDDSINKKIDCSFTVFSFSLLHYSIISLDHPSNLFYLLIYLWYTGFNVKIKIGRQSVMFKISIILKKLYKMRLESVS